MADGLERPRFAIVPNRPTLAPMSNRPRPALSRFVRPDDAPVAWAVSPGLTDYETALSAMEARVAAIAQGEAEEMVWLLEHPPIYTAGVSADFGDLIVPDRFPVFKAGRGGQFTYHGPGQRVVYVMLDLRVRGRDARAFVRALEAWVISALADLGVAGEVRCGRVGVWVERRGAGGAVREDKIAAIGVKLRRWVSFHGLSLNVAPNLNHYDGIVPCGISDHGVTSLADLGAQHDMPIVDAALQAAFLRTFGSMSPRKAPPSP